MAIKIMRSFILFDLVRVEGTSRHLIASFPTKKEATAVKYSCYRKLQKSGTALPGHSYLSISRRAVSEVSYEKYRKTA